MKVDERFPCWSYDIGSEFFEVWRCYTCGAIVVDRQKHNEWHNITEAKENICDAQSADGQQSSK